jgi:hypothetical protein
MTTKTDLKPEPLYTEGVCHDGAAILKDGVMMTIDQVLAELNTRPDTDAIREAVEVLGSIIDITNNPTGCGSDCLQDDMAEINIEANKLLGLFCVSVH